MRGPKRCKSGHRPREGLSSEILSHLSVSSTYLSQRCTKFVSETLRTINSRIICGPCVSSASAFLKAPYRKSMSNQRKCASTCKSDASPLSPAILYSQQGNRWGFLLLIILMMISLLPLKLTYSDDIPASSSSNDISASSPLTSPPLPQVVWRVSSPTPG